MMLNLWKSVPWRVVENKSLEVDQFLKGEVIEDYAELILWRSCGQCRSTMTILKGLKLSGGQFLL